MELTPRERLVIDEISQRLLRARQEPDEFVLRLHVKYAKGIPRRISWASQADEKELTSLHK